MIQPVDIRQGTRSGNVAAIFTVEARRAARIPLFSFRAPCSFPSPADDYLEGPLDFNELLIKNPAATFAVRLDGLSMIGAGLFPGDVAIVDRSLTPKSGAIVLALVDGEFTVNRYRRRAGGVVLQAENKAFPDIPITEGMQFEIWGVVTNSIRML